MKCQNTPQVSMVTILFSIYTAAQVQLHFCFNYFGSLRTNCHSPLKLKVLFFFYFFNNAVPNWGKTKKIYTKEVPCKYPHPIC